MALTIPPASAQSLDDDALAYVEVVASSTDCFVGQTLSIDVRVGLEAELAATQLLQLFPTRLDVPIQLLAPWLDKNAGFDVSLARDSARVGATIALGEGVVAVAAGTRRTLAGRPFVEYALAASFTPHRAGPLVLAGTELRFAYATRFADDVFEGRVPSNRIEASVRASPVTLNVQSLPLDDQPFDFSGAVATQFELSATVEPRTLDFGATTRLTLRVRSNGDLAAFKLPTLDSGPSLRTIGTLDSGVEITADGPQRRLSYDLAPTVEGEVEVPTQQMSYFDPEERDYVTVATQPIAIRVRPQTGSSNPVALDETDSTKQDLRLVIWSALAAAGVAGIAIFARAFMRHRANA